MFGVDIELAGLSLAMGLPTIPFGFAATAATVVSLSLSKKSPVRVDDAAAVNQAHSWPQIREQEPGRLAGAASKYVTAPFVVYLVWPLRSWPRIRHRFRLPRI